MNVVLIGYRGTGKTTIARLLAERLGWEWFDADTEIERSAVKSIARIFADDGEPAFRDWESTVMAELVTRQQAVVALGGGAVMRPANRRTLSAANRVVWLQASPETLWQRISADDSTAERRPNLTTAGGITEIIATLVTRNPIYRECAQLQVDTEGKSPAAVADAILAQLRLG